MTEKKESFIQEITELAKLIPLGYALLILYSSLGQYLFFREFDFPIFNFLSLQDILIISINDVFEALYAIALLLIAGYLSEQIGRVISFIIQIGQNIFRVFKKGEEPKEYQSDSKWQITKTGLSLFLLVTSLLLVIIKPFNGVLLWPLVIINFLAGILTFFIKHNLSLKGGVLLLIVFLFQFKMIINVWDARSFLEKTNQTVEILTNGESKPIDPSLIFMSNTKDYIFFFDQNDSSVIVNKLESNFELRYHQKKKR